MTIGDDSGFMFIATLNVANDPDRAEYEDWFCAQVRSNQILCTKTLYYIICHYMSYNHVTYTLTD